jgi:arabinogalactan endo-1,4-beta-galactosidase
MAVKPIHREAYKLAFHQTKKLKVRGYAKLYVEHMKNKGIKATEVQAYNVMRGILVDYEKLNVIRSISGLPTLLEGETPENEIVSSDIADGYNFQSQKLA